MSLWLLLASLTLLVAAYASALHLSLMSFSQSALERRLEHRGRAAAARWLFDAVDSTILGVALIRTVLRLACFGFTLVAVIGTGEDASLTWQPLVFAGVVTAGLLWLTGGVLASAIARHASVAVVSTGLPLLRVISVVSLPVGRVFGFVDEIVKRLSGANLHHEEAEAQLLRSIEDTQRQGVLDEDAAALLENVVEFRSTTASEVMTPRTDIEGIELTDDLASIRKFIRIAGHSRIPVYTESLDHIAGILYVKDLVPYLGEDASDFKLAPLLRQPIVVPEAKPVGELLAEFQRSEVHMAIVIDEYAGTSGLVTIEDVLEELVGEIHDEHEPADEEVPSIDVIDDMHAEVDGRFYIDDLNQRLPLGLPEDDDFDTIGGFVLAQLGHVPTVGETLEANNARFTALAATPTHIQRIGIELLGAVNGEADGK